MSQQCQQKLLSIPQSDKHFCLLLWQSVLMKTFSPPTNLPHGLFRFACALLISFLSLRLISKRWHCLSRWLLLYRTEQSALPYWSRELFWHTTGHCSPSLIHFQLVFSIRKSFSCTPCTRLPPDGVKHENSICPRNRHCMPQRNESWNAPHSLHELLIIAFRQIQGSEQRSEKSFLLIE